jgi:penicillin amidase
MKKIAFSILIILVLIVLAGAIVVKNISNRAVPDYSATFRIKHLQDSVHIYRDSSAMPHIYARNTNDLYRTTGYLIAQDRLWQMDLLRRVTQGRLSEVLGKDLIDVDILMRSLRMSEKSEQLYKESSPEIRAIFEAYCDGINQFIEEHRKKLPPEFAILGYKPEPWRPQHSFNLVGYMAWDLNGSWVAEIVLHKLGKKLGVNKMLELVPAYDSIQPVIFSAPLARNPESWETSFLAANEKLQQIGTGVFHGSNNWAVGPAKSMNGKPMLANDMHLGLMAPGVWYQIHQVIEGELNVTGVMLPGAPFVISGHNDAIAWGMTNVMNDDIDFYREEISPSDSSSYKLDGEWKKMLVKRETFRIKGGDSVVHALKFTHRGPVVSELKKIADETISMRWLGNEWSDEIRAVYLLNRARNWDDFRNAVKSFVSVSQNIVYADTAGNIGLYCCAGVAKRKGPAWEVLPGNTREYDWKGLVPFDSLPHYYNPASGIAVSANNKTAPVGYPYYISYWYDLPFRFERISRRLQETEKHTPQTFKSIQTDFTSEHVRYYLPGLIKVLNGRVLNTIEKECLQYLKNWDCAMDANMVAPTIYETFFNRLLRDLYRDEMGEELYREFITDKVLVRNAIRSVWSKHESAFIDNVFTKEKKETFDEIVAAAYRGAIIHLAETMGSDTRAWTWGKLHTVVINHPLGSVKLLDRVFNLNRGPYPIGGSFHTVAPYAYKYLNPYESTHGASQRHIYVAGNWDESWTIIPTGISGVPASPYYCSQTDMYLNKQYKHDWFSRQAVVKNAKYRIVLVP